MDSSVISTLLENGGLFAVVILLAWLLIKTVTDLVNKTDQTIKSNTEALIELKGSVQTLEQSVDLGDRIAALEKQIK